MPRRRRSSARKGVAVVVMDDDDLVLLKEDEEPPRGEGSLGFMEEKKNGVTHVVEYFQGVIVNDERFEVGDCVAIKVRQHANVDDIGEREICEIIHLYKRPVESMHEGKAKKDEDNRVMMAEVRRFVEPWELPDCEKKRCHIAKLLESDIVYEVLAATFNYKVRVYFSRRAWEESVDEFEAYWARRHYSLEAAGNNVKLVDGEPKHCDKQRQLRALTYSTLRGLRKEDVQKRKMTNEREALLEAKERLSLSASPFDGNIPCRDKELSTVKRFITLNLTKVVKKDQNLVNTGQQVGMYISGLPGTGKTATVRQAIKDLRNQGFSRYRFISVEINGLYLSAPNQCYQKLWSAINPIKGDLGPMRAHNELKKYFAAREDVTNKVAQGVVLLLDEMDSLVNLPGQAVINNLFEWAGCVNSPHRLIIIGLGNTINLPDRMHTRIRSRLGIERLNFFPYKPDEMENILESRLQGLPDGLIDKTVRSICARQAATQCGDLRRAFNALTVAINLALTKGKTQVSIKEMNQASMQFQRSTPVQFLQSTELSTYLQALVLVAIVNKIFEQGLEHQEESGVTLQDVLSGLCDILSRAKNLLWESLDDDPDSEVAVGGMVEQKDGDEHSEAKRRRRENLRGHDGQRWDTMTFFPTLPSFGELLQMCERMAAIGLVIMTQPKGSCYIRVRLAIPHSDLAQALWLRMQAEKRRLGKERVEGMNEEEEQWPVESPPPWDFLLPKLKIQLGG